MWDRSAGAQQTALTGDVDTGESGALVAQPQADDPYAAGNAGGRVIRGGSLRVIGTMTGVLAGALSAPLVVRHLGEVNYGRYLTVVSVIFVVTALTEGGLGNVAVRLYSAGDESERRSLITNLTGLRLALGVLGAAGAIGFGLVAGYQRVLVFGLLLGSASYMLAGVQGSYAVALAGELRITALAGIDLIRSLLTTILLVGLVFAGSGLTGFYTVALLVQVTALLVTGVLVRRHVPLAPAFERPRWRQLLRETALYALASALGTVYFQVALIVMSLLDPGRQTGYYAISFRIVEVFNTAPWLLAASVLPVLAVAAANDRERLRYVAARVFEGAVIAGGWLAIVIVIGASFGIEVVTGTKHNPAIAVLRIMGIGVTATFLVASWGYVLLSLRLYRALLVANAGALVLALTLSLVLIPAFHARGGAATTAVLELSLASAYVVLLWRHHIRPPPRILACFPLALTLGLGVGALMLSIQSVAAVIAASIVYFAVLLTLHAVPQELLDALPWRR